MKPSALYTLILIALLHLLSAQRASAQDAIGYTAITYDQATNTVRGVSSHTRTTMCKHITAQ